MDLRVLRYFLTVAQEESILGAAKVLYMTQPTLSRQLKELERELGIELFIRGLGTRRIVLTEEGVLLRKRAEEILELVRKTEEELIATKEIGEGNVYIGSGETYVISYLAQIAKKIRDDFPGIRFHMHSGNADDVRERLDKGLIDFGVLAVAPNSSRYSSLRIPAADEWGLLMRRDHPLAQKTTIQADELWDIPLISSSRQDIGDTFSKWLGGDYKKLNHVATYTLPFSASLMVREGLGLALCFNTMPHNDELCFRSLEPPLKNYWYITWQKYQVLSKAADYFFKCLKKNLERD